LSKWWQAVHKEEGYVRGFLLIALFTGMRRSEIARLRWEFIDLEGRILTVPTTKNGDPLELPLSDFLFELLLARRDDDPEGEWVFPGRGETGHMVETKKFYARVTKTSGIRFTTFAELSSQSRNHWTSPTTRSSACSITALTAT
jgi:integrase